MMALKAKVNSLSLRGNMKVGTLLRDFPKRSMSKINVLAVRFREVPSSGHRAVATGQVVSARRLACIVSMNMCDINKTSQTGMRT